MNEQKQDLKWSPALAFKLFKTMFIISAFTFGGGFVIVSLMKKKMVDEYGWLEEKEMLDMTALAQSAPGPIAVNAAVLVGWKMGGFFGMLTAVAATIMPPIIILSIISLFYNAFASSPPVAAVLRGMQAGVAAVLCDVTWNLASNVTRKKSKLSIFIMIAAFICAYVLKINVIFIVLGSLLLGIGRLLLSKKEGKA